MRCFRDYTNRIDIKSDVHIFFKCFYDFFLIHFPSLEKNLTLSLVGRPIKTASSSFCFTFMLYLTLHSSYEYLTLRLNFLCFLLLFFFFFLSKYEFG